MNDEIRLLKRLRREAAKKFPEHLLIYYRQTGCLAWFEREYIIRRVAELKQKKMKPTKRLEILEESLKKKQQLFDNRLLTHFNTVKQANGQPLNDKRNGRSTLKKWDKQNDSLRRFQDEIKKTEAAIERERGRILDVETAKESLPPEILALVESGALIQWRKYPNMFFVPGVDKARIIWDVKKRIVAHKFAGTLTDREHRKRFADVYNPLFEIFNKTK